MSFVGNSLFVGPCAPTAFICRPLDSSPYSNKGDAELVAVHIISASKRSSKVPEKTLESNCSQKDSTLSKSLPITLISSRSLTD